MIYVEEIKEALVDKFKRLKVEIDTQFKNMTEMIVKDLWDKLHTAKVHEPIAEADNDTEKDMSI